MKSIVTLYSIFILVSIASVEARQIKWNFDNPAELEDFEIVRGDWKIENGKLIGTLAGRAVTGDIYAIVTGSSQWTNYVMKAEVTIPEGKYVYFNFRIKDEKNFMTVELNRLPSLIFHQRVNGEYENRNPAGGKADFPLPGFPWNYDFYRQKHVWAIEVKGKDIAVYLDGQKFKSELGPAEVKIKELAPKGKIGFGGDKARISNKSERSRIRVYIGGGTHYSRQV